MRCTCERGLTSLASQAEKEDESRWPQPWFLSAYQVSCHDENHCPQKNLFIFPNNFMKLKVKWSLFYRWGSLGSKSLSILRVVTQLGRDEAGIQARSRQHQSQQFSKSTVDSDVEPSLGTSRQRLPGFIQFQLGSRPVTHSTVFVGCLISVDEW